MVNILESQYFSSTAGGKITLPSDCELQVEVWDMNTAGVGEFLG
jgi:hypothetical protein